MKYFCRQYIQPFPAGQFLEYPTLSTFSAYLDCRDSFQVVWKVFGLSKQKIYLDDSKISKAVREEVEELQNELDTLFNWANSNNMKFNAKKFSDTETS